MSVLDLRLAAQLRERQTLLGLFVGIPSPALVEAVGFAGFDFVVIDNEHGPAGIETTENMIRAARVAGTAPVVRVSSANAAEILRSMDAGASGIQVPQVNTGEMAAAVVQAAKYPPVGNRGTAFSTRAAGFGFHGGPTYMEAVNRGTVVVNHIETVEAVENLEALAIPGVDVLYIGPTDLSVSMGFPGNPGHPEVQETIASCIRRIIAAGAVPGIMVTTVDDVRRYAEMGARYITLNITTLLGGALRATVAARPRV